MTLRISRHHHKPTFFIFTQFNICLSVKTTKNWVLKNTKYQTTKIHSLWHHGCPTWSRDKVMNWGKNTTFTFINFSYLKVRQMIGMLSYDDDNDDDDVNYTLQLSLFMLPGTRTFNHYPTRNKKVLPITALLGVRCPKNVFVGVALLDQHCNRHCKLQRLR